jgi:predicted dehydrogenase
VTVRAAVIGLGVGEQHIAGYRAHPEAEVVAVCDIDEGKRAMARDRYPELRVSADPGELLTADDVDVVSVASYDDAHFEQVKLALEHGKHVFCEKPLCMREEEARELRRLLAERSGLRLSTNVPLRLSPRFRLVHSMIRDGEFGRLFHLEGDYDYGRRHKLTDGWRGQIPWYSVVLGGAIHMVDLLLWLSGDRAVEATALGSRIATEGTAFEHLDFVAALLRLESGATAKVTANLGCVSPHFHGVRVYGTEATFANGLPDGVLHRPAPPPECATSEPVEASYPGVAKGDLIHSFVEAILGRGEPEVGEDDVFEVLATCLAIERSARDGGPVRVEPLG